MRNIQARDIGMWVLATALLVVGSAATATAAEEQLLPPNAKPGECYAKVFIPPTYETETEQVLKKEAAEQIEVIPAQHEWVEEQVVVQEASEEIEVVPPVYEWVEEKVLVKPASYKIEEVPAVYETVEEKVLDKPAHTVWKAGTGPIQKVDHATGEILCLVEVPATYKTIKKRVLKTPATTHRVEIPAEYKTLKKRVVKTPATTRTVKIPAEYKTMKLMKITAEPQEKRIPIPAEYQTLTRTKKTGEARMEWRAILCRTNATLETVTAIQEALAKAGQDPGAIDGVLGTQTMAAVESFQRANGLATGGLTMETLEKLGVRTGAPESAPEVASGGEG